MIRPRNHFCEDKLNLNSQYLTDDYGRNVFEDNSTSIESASVKVYFRNLEQELVKHIEEADSVVGAVAWLTNEAILKAMAKKRYALLVVQKEDFLRPEKTNRQKWTEKLRALYDALPGADWRYDLDGLVRILSTHSDPSIQAVRCVGNHNADKSPAFPRMHNKFLVFCKDKSVPPIDIGYGFGHFWHEDANYDEKRQVMTPYAVWTGSFNMSENATKSLENAVYIQDDAIARAYYNEWAQIESISEPLDWRSPWVAPEWRVGS